MQRDVQQHQLAEACTHLLWSAPSLLPLRAFERNCSFQQQPVVLQDAAAAEAGSEGSKAAAEDGQLEALWTGVVDSLFQSSHERKALGFQLFTILLPNLQ